MYNYVYIYINVYIYIYTSYICPPKTQNPLGFARFASARLNASSDSRKSSAELCGGSARRCGSRCDTSRRAGRGAMRVVEKVTGVGIFWGHWRDFCDISMIFLCFIEKVNLITRSPLVSVENIPREWGKCG